MHGLFRNLAAEGARFAFDDYALDVARRELRRGTNVLAVEPQVFDLLVFLIQHRDRVVSKDDLIEGVWGGRIVSESTLTSRINAVRKAVGDNGQQQRLIRTMPRKGIRFVGDVTEMTASPDSPAPREASSDGVDHARPVRDGAAVRGAHRPSIAALPFANISGDPEQAFFADGMTEEIITGLSRVRWFFVTARTSSFAYKDHSVDAKRAASELGVRYVLEGSLRKDQDRVRINVQLTDGESGAQLWAQRYDRALSSVFELQDEIATTIVGALEPALGKVERQRARSRKPGNLDAWEVYQHGMSHLYQLTKDDLLAARRFFEQAIAMDPELGMAYSGIAEALYYESVYGFAESIEANREKALAPALRAVALDPEDAGAHCTLGRTHYMRRELAAAIIELSTALELNPSSALAHYGMGAALVFSGKTAEAVPYLKSAMRLSPYDPNMGSILVRLADAAYFEHNYEDAIEWGRKALQQPQFQWSRYAVVLAALGQLGRPAEARQLLGQVKKLWPDFSLSFVRRTHLFDDVDKFEHYLDGLRKVGVVDDSVEHQRLIRTVPESHENVGEVAEPTAASGTIPILESLAGLNPPQQVHFCSAADGARIAYAVAGSGPPLVKAANWLNHVEYDWRSPVWSHLLHALAAQYRLIRYDERGNGLSDWDADISFEAFVRDLESVVDAAGVEKFALLGISGGCSVSIVYALRHPERVTHLILYGGAARGRRKRGEKATALSDALHTLMLQGWGQENPAFRQLFTSMFIPGGTAEQAQWFNDLQRNTTSPENAVRLTRAREEVDIEHLLPELRVPTLVLHRRGDALVPFEEGRRMAAGIQGARFVALDGGNHLVLQGELATARLLEEITNFLK